MLIATSMAGKKVVDNISSLKKILELERAVKISNAVDTKTIEGKLRKPKKDGTFVDLERKTKSVSNKWRKRCNTMCCRPTQRATLNDTYRETTGPHEMKAAVANVSYQP